MPGKRVPFKDSKMVEFMQMLLKATREGRELSSKDMQAHFDLPGQWGRFKIHAQRWIETATGGTVTIKSRRVNTAYYRLEGDPTILEVELELRKMSDEERAELLRWSIEEKHRREQEAKEKPV